MQQEEEVEEEEEEVEEEEEEPNLDAIYRAVGVNAIQTPNPRVICRTRYLEAPFHSISPNTSQDYIATPAENANQADIHTPMILIFTYKSIHPQPSHLLSSSPSIHPSIHSSICPSMRQSNAS